MYSLSRLIGYTPLIYFSPGPGVKSDPRVHLQQYIFDLQIKIFSRIDTRILSFSISSNFMLLDKYFMEAYQSFRLMFGALTPAVLVPSAILEVLAVVALQEAAGVVTNFSGFHVGLRVPKVVGRSMIHHCLEGLLSLKNKSIHNFYFSHH